MPTIVDNMRGERVDPDERILAGMGEPTGGYNWTTDDVSLGGEMNRSLGFWYDVYRKVQLPLARIFPLKMLGRSS